MKPKSADPVTVLWAILTPSFLFAQVAIDTTQYDEADLNKSQKSRVKIDGFLYPNIFLINNQHSLKSYQIGNIEKFSKEVFFRLTTFFSAKKNYPKFFFLHSVFNVLEPKKIFRVIRKFFEKFSFQKTLSKFWKKKFSKFFRITLKFFFTFQYIKNWMEEKKFWIIFLSGKKSC